MHLRRVRIENVRSIRELEWVFEEGKEAGWHVVLGNNGSGKSAVLQAIALCLINQKWPGQPPLRWVRHGTDKLDIGLEYGDGTSVSFGFESGKWKFRDVTRGVFSCGLGSMRRFGPRAYGDEPKDEPPVYARHRSLFKQEAVLTDALDWLQDLEFRALKARESQKSGGEAERLLANVRRFVNETGLLPYGATMGEITPDAVEFVDGNGVCLGIEELSDGYHSVLGIAFELIRRLVESFLPNEVWSNDDPPRIISSGVVMIDEIDAHLHPSWQREIGYWFTKWFPNMQFIVTTHSPLVCQAAEHGSIMRLPDPGRDELPYVVEGLERDQLLYGSVLDAYATESFGHVPTRSKAGKLKLEDLARLNQKLVHEGLDEAELEQRERLLRMLPTGNLQNIDAAE